MRLRALTAPTAVCDSSRIVQDSAASAPARQAVDLQRFAWSRPLARDYCRRFEPLAPFYAGNPSSRDAWASAIARTRAHPRDRGRLVSLLTAQQARRGAPRAAVASAERLADPGSVAVVTGQQAGLFGGPLYTLLKALTAVQLASMVTREHGVPAVPVFWIDGEDHDWDEVSSVVVLDAEYQARRVTVPRPPGAGELPVAAVTLDGGVDAAIEGLRTALAPTEFTAQLLDELARAYAAGRGMADAFGRWLEVVLGPLGVVVYDSADPAAKPLVAPVFVRELAEPGRTFEEAAQAGAELEALGYHSQVAPHPDGVALFRLDPGRHPIRRAAGGLVVGDASVDAETLRREAESSPERFSPNVLLRPLVQDTIFPTVCYVSGPSELAYLGQLGGVYRRFGVPMPLVYPRATATILDAGAARFLARYEVPLESLQPQDEAELNRLLEALLPPAVEASLDASTKAVEESLAAVIAAVPTVDPTLEGAARSTLGRMTHDLRTLHQKVIHAAKRRDETLRRQFHRAQAQAFPNGHPQERELGFVFFLNRYGPALPEILLRELPLDLGRHWVLTL